MIPPLRAKSGGTSRTVFGSAKHMASLLIPTVSILLLGCCAHGKRLQRSSPFAPSLHPTQLAIGGAGPVSPDIADWERIETLGLPPQDDLQSVTLRLLGGAQNDLVAFKRMPGWPRHCTQP